MTAEASPTSEAPASASRAEQIAAYVDRVVGEAPRLTAERRRAVADVLGTSSALSESESA